MAKVSGANGGTSIDTLARVNVLPNRHLPHSITAIGDSRIAAIWLDTARRSKGARSPLHWANALLDQRLVIGDCFGVSGDRTDQMLARLPAALAANAGLLYIQGGVNDIAQGYPSATTSGATAYANIRKMADAARMAGFVVVIEAEVGAASFNSASLVSQVNELNALLYAYAEQTPGIFLHDARALVMQSAFSDTALQYQSGYSADGTHVVPRGAWRWGQSLAVLLSRIIPSHMRVTGQSRTELPGNGRRQLLLNPHFVTASGGNLVNGATGVVPANWSGRRISTNTSLSFSTAIDPDGLGNSVVMNVSFAAAGEEVRLYQDVNAANWQVGDIVELYGDVEIVGAPTCLASVHGYLGHNNGAGGVTFDSFDLVHGAVSEGGPDGPMRLTLRTRPYAITAAVGAGPFLTAHIRATSTAAGSVQILVHQCGVRRRS